MRSTYALVAFALVTTANVAFSAPAARAVIIDSANATPANPGINPQFFALDINAKILVGGNPCEARGVTVRLEQKRVGRNIEVSALKSGSNPNRICTREWNPQYKLLTTTVRARSRDVADVLVKNLRTLGNTASAYALVNSLDETVVTNVETSPANGGINPDAFAMTIRVSVEGGSNPCMAANNKITLQQKQIGRVIYVKAIKELVRTDVMCTMEYAPVIKTLTTTVRAFGSQIDDVIIENVDELGNDRSASDFIQN